MSVVVDGLQMYICTHPQIFLFVIVVAVAVAVAVAFAVAVFVVRWVGGGSQSIK